MASFGSFETDREVYSDLVYTVYFARKQGDPDGEYAVKVFVLPDPGLESELVPGEVHRDEMERSRLEGISVQQAAAAGSRNVAPILERGNDSRGLWYATRFYPRSVNKMMSGKVVLPRAALEHIIRSITQGALDMKRICGRSHGDIQPTNVQVSKTEKLTEAEVMLCDPLPGGIEQSARYELSDLRAIGLILLQLVRQRLLSTEEAGLLLPISPGGEWIRIFGAQSSEWLGICNRLLDPNLSLDNFTLEALMGRLDELKPKHPDSRKLLVVAVSVLLMLIAVAFWLMRTRTEVLEITSDPPGATVTVNHSAQQNQTPVRLKLRRGTYLIEARHDQLGLSEEATNLLVQPGIPSSVHFQFAYGSIAIKSDPPGATILREGVRIGRTETNGQLFIISVAPPGTAKYQLKLEQYEGAELLGVVTNHQRLELVASLRRSESITNPPGAVGRTTNPEPVQLAGDGFVELRSEPVRASILDRDGRELGRASRSEVLSLTVAPGQYSYTARADALGDVTTSITVKSAQTSRHTFVFDCGTVDWTTEPVPATVSSGGLSQVTPAHFVQKPGVAFHYVITAPGYQTRTEDITVQSGQAMNKVARLVLQTISVALVSDPPGAQFVTMNGTVLTRNETNSLFYDLPLGPVTLVARYASLGEITNQLEVTGEKNGSRVDFRFDYGTLILTNLPPDTVVFEGDRQVGAVTDKWVYQKPGQHYYALRRQASSQNLALNIMSGLNMLRVATAQKTWTNSLGMPFAWIPNLPGGGLWPGQSELGGWVAISETTQGQYKRMDGSNPSRYQDGGNNYPVENLTWDQAMTYCRWLGSADSSEHSGWRYTLPTDEQFSAFSGDADRVARVTNEGRTTSDTPEIFSLPRGPRIPAAANLNTARTHPEPVGSTKHPNQFGLYDVVGNVWEWLGSSSGKDNVYAGGSYFNFEPKMIVAKARDWRLEKGRNIGFRVVLLPAP